MQYMGGKSRIARSTAGITMPRPDGMRGERGTQA